MNFLVRTFLKWLPLGVAVTLVCGLVYVTVQQNYRQSLNDPQIQMAEDAAQYLETANSPDASEVIPLQTYPTDTWIDFGTSLAPWIAIVNPDGTVYQEQVADNGVDIETSGEMADWGAPNGPSYSFPPVPVGVLQAAASNEGKDTDQPYEDRITWQPGAGVREAIVVVAITEGPYKGDFVVAGRNMQEVEDREGILTEMVGIGWVVTMIATFVVQLFAGWML